MYTNFGHTIGFYIIGKCHPAKIKADRKQICFWAGSGIKHEEADKAPVLFATLRELNLCGGLLRNIRRPDQLLRVTPRLGNTLFVIICG